ncbi:hypothetical protein ZWY2020_050781 [Hordeum vulgare]|nr:hypothetical protein ZWY2020_050781 [Hordeum vulgare]
MRHYLLPDPDRGRLSHLASSLVASRTSLAGSSAVVPSLLAPTIVPLLPSSPRSPPSSRLQHLRRHPPTHRPVHPKPRPLDRHRSGGPVASPHQISPFLLVLPLPAQENRSKAVILILILMGKKPKWLGAVKKAFIPESKDQKLQRRLAAAAGTNAPYPLDLTPSASYLEARASSAPPPIRCPDDF